MSLDSFLQNSKYYSSIKDVIKLFYKYYLVSSTGVGSMPSTKPLFDLLTKYGADIEFLDIGQDLRDDLSRYHIILNFQHTFPQISRLWLFVAIVIPGYEYRRISVNGGAVNDASFHEKEKEMDEYFISLVDCYNMDCMENFMQNVPEDEQQIVSQCLGFNTLQEFVSKTQKAIQWWSVVGDQIYNTLDFKYPPYGRSLQICLWTDLLKEKPVFTSNKELSPLVS